jgi:hypothetical protein
MNDEEDKLVEKMLMEENSKKNNLQNQLAKLDETMEKLKADYIRQHNILISELNKTIGSVETLTRLNQHAKKEKPRESSGSTDTGNV